MSIGNNGGRPRKFETPEELEECIDTFIAKCESDDKPLTMTGLALGLGFCDRQSLYDYQKDPKFSCLIKKALLEVENSYEQRACSGNAAGPIFVLKNMGWSDKQEIKQELTVSGAPVITFSDTTHKEE